MDPLVSAVVPLYRDHPYLSECVESLNSQTYDNLEVVFVDSGDNAWVPEEVEHETKYTQQPPEGPARARNAAIERASGEYVAFLDSDDTWKEEKIEKQIEHVDDYDFVYSDQLVRKDDNRIYQSSIDFDENPSVEFFRSGHGIPLRTVLVRSEHLRDGPFDESLRAREDPHLWTRILRHADPKGIDEALATKRKRDDSLTTDIQLVYEEEIKEIEDLTSRFDEYRQFEDERLYEANFRRARKELSIGNRRTARKYLRRAVEYGEPDARHVACTVVAMLPFGNRTALNGLQKVQGMIS